jgi:SpoVK/Ycf46/Vps4 family AAA+-type ATPase
MSVERLHQALHLESGHRFLILYGEGLEDNFITPDLEIVNIQTALLSLLKSEAFKRVAFLSPQQPVYFLDPESQDLSMPRGLYDREPSRSEEMRILREGPLSNRFLLPLKTVTDLQLLPSGMGDVHALRWLDAVMQSDDGIKSAVIITQAEAAIQYNDDPRTLAGLIGSWAQLPVGNASLCILLFSAANQEQLGEIAQQLPIPEVRSVIQNGHQTHQNSALCRIPVPDEHEIKRLLMLHQQQGTLALEEDPATLSSWLSSEMLSLRQWAARLDTVPRLDRASARRMGWISAVRDPNISAEQQISELVGLHRVKQHLSELSAWLYLQSQRKPAGEAPLLHMVFSGNPGTGKTTIARLIGEIYHDMGLLKRGHLVEARASDLIAPYVGGTTGRTDQLVDQAIDGVLFIDEAYILTEPDRGGFGQEAIDTLLSRMENDRGRLVVIVAGYPDKMRRFLQSNPGLARRFPIENHYDFPDFSPDELTQILFRNFSNRGISIEEHMRDVLAEIVQGLYDVRDESFGNAGEMRSLCDAVDRRRAARVVRSMLDFDTPLTLDDLPDKYRAYLVQEVPDMHRLMAELDELVGLQDVKNNIRRLGRRLELEQIRHQQIVGIVKNTPLQHLVFLGNPGTGKTTIARMIGRLYRSLGILKRGHVIEVSRSDLVAGYVGQTAIKTMDRIKAALDGVLFIDEAYSLVGGSNDYGQEAVDTLVKAMEDYRGRFVVIAAGYPEEMQEFLYSNPGLRSRFSQPLFFPDYGSDELAEILKGLSSRESYILSQEVIERVVSYLDIIRSINDRSFGNARTVQSIFECMKDALAERVLSEKGVDHSAISLSTFVVDDVPVPAGIVPAPGLRFGPIPRPLRKVVQK